MKEEQPNQTYNASEALTYLKENPNEKLYLDDGDHNHFIVMSTNKNYIEHHLITFHLDDEFGDDCYEDYSLYNFSDFLEIFKNKTFEL